MTRQSQVERGGVIAGWMWRRHSPNSWERCYCRGSNKRLSLFADEKEEELVDVINLGTVSLSEVALQDGSLGSGGRRHSRGLVLRRAEAAAAAAVQQGQQQLTLPPLDDPSELESLLRSGRLARSSSSSSNLGLRCEELLAAEDAAQHSAWLKRLSKACGNRCKLLESGNEAKQQRPYSTGIRSPPQSVLQRLCGPGLLRGRQLMERLRNTRWQLEAGLRDLSSVREEARAVQRPLSDLHAVLLDMSQALDVHHADITQEEDVAALRACQDWLQGAVTFVMEVDQQIEALVYAEPGASVAADWVPLAGNTLLQLRDIEDSMRAEELRQLQRQRQAGSASGLSCRSVVSAPAMPYSSWWAGKVAL